MAAQITIIDNGDSLTINAHKMAYTYTYAMARALANAIDRALKARKQNNAHADNTAKTRRNTPNLYDCHRNDKVTTTR